MEINNPLFLIPESNKKNEQKTGGGASPPYLGDKNSFIAHKRQRVIEIDNILKISKSIKPVVSNPNDLTFFEIQFHEKAISKSAQPTALLSIGQIDLYSQKDEFTFFAATNERSILSFRDTISKFDLKANRDDSAYLSAITKISPIQKEDILVDIDLKEKNIQSFLFFQNILSEKECYEIYKSLVEEYSIRGELITSVSGAKVIYGNFASSFLDTISTPHPKNPIQRIEKSIGFTVPQGITIQHQYENIKVLPPTSDAIVGIVDSGIEPHEVYKDLIIDTYDPVKDSSLQNFSHGTLVGTRAIFGNDIEDQIIDNGNLFAMTRVLDIRVLRKGKKGSKLGVSDKDLIDNLKDVLEKYSNLVKIYNLSLNGVDFITTHKKKRGFISLELDALAYKYKVLFVISAGNHDTCQKKPYPECLLDDRSVITPPADILNGIIVGSVSDTESSRSLAYNNEPSPFTRSGLLDSKKPDVVHFGGNLDKYYRYNGLGVKGFSVFKDFIEENVGTSFSAPLVSQIAAQIYSFLINNTKWKTNPIDLTRALLLHSAKYNLPQQSKINLTDLKRLVGFGIPDMSRALDCADSVATFVYCDTLGMAYKEAGKVFRGNKHKIKFIVPNELVGKNKKVKIKGTLVYTPQTSSAPTLDHSLVDIEINIHYFNSARTLVSGKLGDDIEDNREKWNPVKSFEKTYNAYAGGEWEVWLTLNARGIADVKDFTQDYALVLSVEDVTLNISERVNVHQLVREKHQEYIQILAEQVQIES